MIRRRKDGNMAGIASSDTAGGIKAREQEGRASYGRRKEIEKSNMNMNSMNGVSVIIKNMAILMTIGSVIYFIVVYSKRVDNDGADSSIAIGDIIRDQINTTSRNADTDESSNNTINSKINHAGDKNDGDGTSGGVGGGGSKREKSSTEKKLKILTKDDFVPARTRLDHELYQHVYDSHQELEKEAQVVADNNTPKENSGAPQVSSMETYGDDILTNGCNNLTVLLMDPRLPNLTAGSSIFFALESVGAFLPEACVILQTSSCSFDDEHGNEHGNGNGNGNENGRTYKIDEESEKDKEHAIYQRIYQHSLPLFRGMIDRGQVRVTFLQHELYNFKECDNYPNPSSALMNIHYWSDMDYSVGDRDRDREHEHGSSGKKSHSHSHHGEYIAGVDSDTVLIMQSDSILCHPINIELYRQYAYVGGVWNRRHAFTPTVDMCHLLEREWQKYTRTHKRLRGHPQKHQQKQKHQHNNDNYNGNNSNNIPPPKPKPFPTICTGDGTAPMGNGGLSLRSRKAIRKAIQDCPSREWSGLHLSSTEEQNENASSCSIHGTNINEDVYFGTVLRATGALLPTALEAALFSVEIVWPEESISMYHNANNDNAGNGDGDGSSGSAGAGLQSGLSMDERQRFVSDRGSIYRGATIDTSDALGVEGSTREDTVPFGFHKPWWYFDNKILRSKDVDEQCPLLKYMFHPDQNSAMGLPLNKMNREMQRKQKQRGRSFW